MNVLAYTLESASWFLGGVVVSSLYWRWFYHRVLAKDGTARKEPPLNVFIALLSGLVLAASMFVTQAQRISFQNYVVCQAHKDEQFRNRIADYSRVAKDDRRNLRNTVLDLLAKGNSGNAPNPFVQELQHGVSVKRVLIQAFENQGSDAALERLVNRSRQIDSIKLPPLSLGNCPPPPGS